MNAVYQYAILENYSRATAGKPLREPSVQPVGTTTTLSPTPEPTDPTPEPSEPITEGGTPIKDEGTQTTTTLAPPSKEVRDTTTINVYQGLPADITTAAGTSIGGGFGGGGISLGEDEKPKSIPKKTLLPAMAALAGGIFLLVKPLD